MPHNADLVQALLKLWYHECLRTFADRMTSQENREHFNQMIIRYVLWKCIVEYDFSILKEYTNISWKQESLVEEYRLFGDYLKIGGFSYTRPYQMILNPQELPELFSTYLKSYNMQNKNEMKLVFFDEAVEHVSRISRAIRQTKGHLLLLGVGGMGKRSLTRFASYLCSYGVFEIFVSKGYGQMEFREDLKKLGRLTGVQVGCNSTLH